MKAKSNCHALSPMEEALFAALSKRPRSSTELTKIVYRGRRKPFHATKSILTVARSLQRKRKEVQSSQRSGPYPIEFWIA